MEHLTGVVTGPRPGSMRDRRGRGRRGPVSLPGPLTPRGVPAHRSAREAFDHLVGEVLGALEHHVTAEPDRVEVVVEDVPLLGPGWEDDVPLSSLAAGGDASTVTIYRRPIEERAVDARDLEDLVWSVVLERLGEVWHLSPDDLDPRRR